MATKQFKTKAKDWQSNWRKEHRYPVGMWKGREVSSLVDEVYAKQHRINFVTPEIGRLVAYTVNNKEPGAMISEPRIWNNLLTSQALCFNLFGGFALNLDKATEYLGPFFALDNATITKIGFEHSPGRNNGCYTNDKTAFDVFVEYKCKNGKHGFVGIEVKYVENMYCKPTTKQQRYEELSEKLSREFPFFNKNNICQFKECGALNQIWRDHLLALAMIRKQDYDEGKYVFIYPSENNNCKDAINKYLALLGKGSDCFCQQQHIEPFMILLSEAFGSGWPIKLRQRYFGFLEISTV